MTTYTVHADAIFNQDKPVLAATHLEARDNLIAVCEGDATAPSVLPNVAAKTLGGGVGTYAFVRQAASNLNFGTAVAGSSLAASGYTGVASAAATVTSTYSSALSGTWRIMGQASFSGSTPNRHTLAMRIV